MISISKGKNLYKLTGNAENFITAATCGYWGVNEYYKNVACWEKLEEGDIVVFHATLDSSFKAQAKSVIIGWAEVTGEKAFKNESNWIQEFPEDVQRAAGVTTLLSGYWPYIFGLKNVHFFIEDLSRFDFSTPIQDKSIDQIKYELNAVYSSGFPLRVFKEDIKNNANIGFQNQASIQKLSPALDVLKVLNSYQLRDSLASTKIAKLPSVLDLDNDTEVKSSDFYEYLDNYSKEELIELAKKYKHSGDHYKTKEGSQKVRVANRLQIARIAKIEDFSCQVCGYVQPYQNKKGEQRWIYDVDHILDKSKSNGEGIDNLWVLCPTCHREKTRGVIKIDPKAKTITRLGLPIRLHHDSHLNWPEVKNKKWYIFNRQPSNNGGEMWRF